MDQRPPSDLRLPSIEGLRAFELAARLGTFERAAESLSVTASAVGKRIATLEDLLGTPLFLRRGKSLTLTVAGREYLAQVNTALGMLAAVPLHRRGAQRQERLRVTAPPTFARQILVPALEGFSQAHPEVELEIVLSIPYLGTAAPEGADHHVEITHAPDPDGGLALLHDRVLPIAAPALIERLGLPRRPSDLVDWPLLRTPIEPWQPWLRAVGLDWPEPVRGPRLVDLGLTLEAALCGQGAALARPTLAQRELTDGRLRPLFALSVPATQRYRLRPHRPDGPAAHFGDWLRAVCAERERVASEWLSGLG